MDEERWKKIKDKLPKNLNWRCRPATRENKKEKARGGIMTGISKKIENLEYREQSENVVEWRLRHNRKQWRVMTVYSQNVKEVMNSILDRIEKNEEDVLIIGGDCNARTENEGGWINEDFERENSRKSKDKIINSEGRRLISKSEEREWTILNGSKGEEEK